MKMKELKWEIFLSRAQPRVENTRLMRDEGWWEELRILTTTITQGAVVLFTIVNHIIPNDSSDAIVNHLIGCPFWTHKNTFRSFQRKFHIHTSNQHTLHNFFVFSYCVCVSACVCIRTREPILFVLFLMTCRLQTVESYRMCGAVITHHVVCFCSNLSKCRRIPILKLWCQWDCFVNVLCSLAIISLFSEMYSQVGSILLISVWFFLQEWTESHLCLAQRAYNRMALLQLW